MNNVFDVIVIGSGGGGAVIAKELGEKGIKVLVLEAGPWYGNSNWPDPNNEDGVTPDGSSYDKLSAEILHKCFTGYESDMSDILFGKFRWGSANRELDPWFRNIPQGGFSWQSAGVGGNTLIYFANCPRAFPVAVDNTWPISYNEIIPYYEKAEGELPVSAAPMTAKEELFFYGLKKAGWQLIKTLNVRSPGYRPQPNAILRPNLDINNPDFIFDGKTEGCTLCGHCINGCGIGPNIEKTAKRSTLVSYVPLALKTGNVKIYPNTFVTKILTEKDHNGNVVASGIKCRNTWTGRIDEIKAKVIVMAAGCIENPRLWLNSKLPKNPWVGRGISNHYFDCVAGIFDEKILHDILGVTAVEPYIGQNSAGRFDYPGLGCIQTLGISPGLYSTLLYSLSSEGYNFLREPNLKEKWDITGRVVGEELKTLMLEYPRTLNLLVSVGDEPGIGNGVTLHPYLRDNHGAIPKVKYTPCKRDKEKREKLTAIAADILKKAGAKKIIRSNLLPSLFIHTEATMRMGYVTDSDCEAFQVKRLFISDNSVHYNSLGGPNPTLTTQALAIRTAEKLTDKYF